MVSPRFYESTRAGPIFGAHVADASRHLANMVDFRSSPLRGSGAIGRCPSFRRVSVGSFDRADAAPLAHRAADALVIIVAEKPRCHRQQLLLFALDVAR